MEQTPLPPLVSDQRIRDIETGKFASERMYEMNYRQGMQDMRDLYEADRQRTREVVQALVNMIHHRWMVHPMDVLENAKYYASGGLSTVDALALAKSRLQIEPTK